MFGLPKQTGTSYSGDGSYRYIDTLLEERSRELKIISPFIGPAYAKKLIEESKRKKIFVITSGSSNSDAVEMLTKKGKKYYLKPVFYLSVAGVAAIYLKFYTIFAAIGFAIVLAIALNIMINRKRSSNLSVKVVTDKFIHEKLYLNDTSAIVGSANLTYSGTHKNIEHIEVVKEKEKVKSLSRHFDDMWSKF